MKAVSWPADVSYYADDPSKPPQSLVPGVTF